MTSKRVRGFTRLELTIVLGTVGTVALIVLGFMFRSCASSRSTAEGEARAYAKSMDLNIQGVSCMNRDTNGDGYVSCSLSVLEKNGVKVIPIECATRWSFNNDGCKAPVLPRGVLP